MTHDNDTTTLVIEATGKTGRRVTDRLRGPGEAFVDADDIARDAAASGAWSRR